MVRESLSADAKNAFVYFSAADGLQLSVRSTTGGQTRRTLGSSDTPPAWLRLLKVGNTVYGYASADGASWDLVGQETLTIASSRVYVGFAVSSGVAGTLNQATFSRESVVNNLPYGMAKLALWLRGDAGVTKDGSNKISGWLDQSGSGNHGVQPTGANQPVWTDNQLGGKPTIRFNAANGTHMYVPSSTNLNSQRYTVVAVGSHSATSSGIVTQKFDTSGLSQFALFFKTPGVSYISLRSGTTDVSAATSLSMSQLLIGSYDGSALRLWVNGASPATLAFSDSLVTSQYPLWIGGQSTNYGITGDIPELMVFTEALSDADRQRIEAYIYQRYGIGTRRMLSTPAITGSNPGGIYASAQTVTINVPTGARVYYTTDGSEPSEFSNLYSGPISITTTTTLKFTAFRGGFAPSATVTTGYVIDNLPFTNSGLLGWWRADQGVTKDGSNKISGWSDLSGNGNHAVQTTSANQPVWTDNQLNGKPVVRFAGSSGTHLAVANTTGLNPSQITMIAVTKQSSSAFGIVAQKVTNPTTNQYALYFSNGTTPMTAAGSAASANGTLTQGDFGVMEGRYNGSQVDLWVNGALAGTTAFSGSMGTSTYPLWIGGQGTGSGLTGDIAELLVFGRALTDLERQEVEAYLKQRYNIGAQPAVPAPAPVLSSPAIFTGTKDVTITSPIGGTTIYYTMNGTDPDTSSTQYNPGNPITISATTTIKARAYRTGYALGAVASATYTLDASATNIPRTSLGLWLRADVGVTNGTGSSVAGWADQSGNGNVASQVTAANQPSVIASALNGKPVVRFDGGSDYLEVANATSVNPVKPVIYIIGRRASTDADAAILRKGGFSFDQNPPMTYALEGSGGNATAFRVGSGTANGTLTTNNYFVARMTYDGAVMAMNKNGVLQGSAAYTTAVGSNGAPVRIGGWPLTGYSGTTGKYLNGDIAEVLMFRDALTLKDQLAVEKYLGDRYGITIDSDGDGLADWKEAEIGTNANDADSNDNGLNDGAEYSLGYNPVSNDTDGDGLNNDVEIALGTNPFWSDSDGDGVPDGTDKYPLDPTASTNTDPTSGVAPTISLQLPQNAVLLP